MSEVKVFYIAGFKIDLSRSTIENGDHQVSVEPKVLKVLLLLAKHQNEVVSHKEIMAQVWQGTEVVPNALQRCIAILRKELGDDAKSPKIIATHPRIGYRLLVDVNWQNPTESSPLDDLKTQTKHQNKSVIKIAALISIFIAALFSVNWGLNRQESPAEQYTKIRQLTQTDAHETHAIFSPDGNYIVFNRYAGSCKTHIWAKTLVNGQESQLTNQPGYYGAPSFTPDGRELVFAAKQNCDQYSDSTASNTSEKTCWSIASLDFALGLAKSQQAHLRYQCQAENLVTPKALANHQYAFFQQVEGINQLVKYDDLSKKLTTIYSPSDEYFYHFDYDAQLNRYVVFSKNQQLKTIIKILDENGQLQSQSTLKLLLDISQNQYISGYFEPNGDYILAVHNNQLYQISFNGQIQLIDVPQGNLISVVKHPNKQEILAIQGKKDIDITQVTLGEKSVKGQTEELNKVELPFQSLSRTTAQERNPQYQPNGEVIAFISDRSGQDQIWLWQGNKAAPFSREATHNSIQNFSWSPNGKKLAWISESDLIVASLEGNRQVIKTEKPLYSVLSWHKANQLLVTLNDPFPKGLYLLDIEENKLTPFNLNYIESAWVVDQQLIYSNDKGEVFTRSIDIANPQLKQQPQLNGKALFINDGLIYSVNPKTFWLTQYDLDGKLIKAVMQLKPTAWKVAGLSANQLLLSQFISIDHELVLVNK